MELLLGAEGKGSVVVGKSTGEDKAGGVECVGTELVVSELVRGATTEDEARATDAPLTGRTGDPERLGLAGGGEDGPLRPKKDSRPPLAFLLASVD